jgi:hypothetical protein
MRRYVVLGFPVLLALALRAYPLPFPHLGIETQEAYVGNALVALARDNWRPNALHHGSAFFDVLRAAVTGCYEVGRLAGWYHDPLDPLANFLRDPLPFVMVGRVVALVAAVATVALVAVVGARWFGTTAGAIGALLLSVCVIHVRESLHVWPDCPAAGAAFAAVAAALWALRRGTTGSLVGAGAAAGLAIATKHTAAPVVLAVALAAVWGAGRPVTSRAYRLVGAGIVTVAVYLSLAPYALLDSATLLEQLAVVRIIFVPTTQQYSLTVAELVGPCLGWPMVFLAFVGAAHALRRDPIPTVTVLLFPVTYAVIVQRSILVLARYLVPLAPFAALFAGNGIVVIARQASPRWRPWVAIGMTAGALAGPLHESLAQVRMLAREDTRQLAASWLHANVAGDTVITLSDMVGHASPVLPMPQSILRLTFPDFAQALLARGVGTSPAFQHRRWIAFMGQVNPDWRPTTEIVVTATYPIRVPGLSSPAALEALRAAGATPEVVFEGAPTPLPPTAVVDRADAEYIPLRGAAALERPGPTLTVWRVPGMPPSPDPRGAGASPPH